MKNQHPIVPPQALIKSWEDKIIDSDFGSEVEEALFEFICSNFLEVYQAGADHELEACCEWLRCEYDWGLAAALRMDAERRPDHPSLKEQALESLTKIEDNKATYLDSSIIRRALETLPE